jgi:hypothetical protein
MGEVARTRSSKAYIQTKEANESGCQSETVSIGQSQMEEGKGGGAKEPLDPLLFAEGATLERRVAPVLFEKKRLNYLWGIKNFYRLDRKIPPITPHDKSLGTQFEA